MCVLQPYTIHNHFQCQVYESLFLTSVNCSSNKHEEEKKPGETRQRNTKQLVDYLI